MITVARARTRVDLTSEERDRLREQYRARHHLRLPRLLEPELLSAILTELERATFRERVHPRVGRELCMERNGAHLTLELLLNDRAFLDIIEDLTGCGHIGSFGGRVYRVVPGQGHADSWHGDVVDHRLVAMSVNLSRAPYRGGHLALREAATGRVLAQAENLAPGDALVFRLAPWLEHRITDVEGDAPKTAFAGWFHARPEFAEVLAQATRVAPHGDGGALGGDGVGAAHAAG